MNQSTSLPQEVLLRLSTQLNSFSTILRKEIEPSLINSINSIESIASLYQSIINFINSNQSINSNHHHHSFALASFASSLNRQLSQYQSILTNLEINLLSHHSTLVPYDSNCLPSPPLSAILVELTPWRSIFYSINQLLHQIQLSHSNPQCSTPELINLLFQHSLTGSPQLSKILIHSQISLEHLWMDAFRSFVIYGQRPQENLANHHQRELIDDLFFAQRTPPPGITTDQIKHHPLIYLLKPDALPHLPSLNPHSRILHSLSQICLSLSILSHLHQLKSNRSRSNRLLPLKLILPNQLQSQLSNTLSKIDHLSHPAFRQTIESVQDILSSHLFTTYLTPDILFATLRSLADVFLFQHPSFTANLVNGFNKLRQTRLLSSLHRSRRSISLSERELDVILLKAAVSTDTDQSSQPINLNGFGFTLFTNSSNSLDDLHPSSPESISQKFSTLLLDEQFPMLLTFTPTPDLSLFLTKESCLSYSLIHSCLFSFLMVRDRLKESWITLGRRERERRRWGKDLESLNQNLLSRICWETRRLISWWIEEMISHFWMNVINLNVIKLIKQIKLIESSLNFKSLAILHSHFLFKISFGLCLFESNLLNSLLKKSLKVLNELDGSELELFPPLLFQSNSDPTETDHQNQKEDYQIEIQNEKIQFKLKRMNELRNEFKLELNEFFKTLLNLNQTTEKSNITLGGNHQTLDQSMILLRGIKGSIPSWLESLGNLEDESNEVLRESKLDSLVFKRTIINQLLSKLDFSGFFSFDHHEDLQERVLDGI